MCDVCIPSGSPFLCTMVGYMWCWQMIKTWSLLNQRNSQSFALCAQVFTHSILIISGWLWGFGLAASCIFRCPQQMRCWREQQTPVVQAGYRRGEQSLRRSDAVGVRDLTGASGFQLLYYSACHLLKGKLRSLGNCNSCSAKLCLCVFLNVSKTRGLDSNAAMGSCSDALSHEPTLGFRVFGWGRQHPWVILLQRRYGFWCDQRGFFFFFFLFFPQLHVTKNPTACHTAMSVWSRLLLEPPQPVPPRSRALRSSCPRVGTAAPPGDGGREHHRGWGEVPARTPLALTPSLYDRPVASLGTYFDGLLSPPIPMISMSWLLQALFSYKNIKHI